LNVCAYVFIGWKTLEYAYCLGEGAN
jgi:hypothetical protein